MKLAGKSAVITGAGSGIGAAMARRFAAEGSRVVLLDVDEAAAGQVSDAICQSGGSAVPVGCDVTDASAVEAAIGTLPQLDILVNNAGVGHVGTAETTTVDDFDRLMSVNVRGVFHCLRAALPRLRARNGGVILNLCSVAARIGLESRFAYSATKGAVLAMTLSVARDYLAHGIRCNCLCPARIHTPFVDAYLEKNYPERRDEVFAELSRWQPIGRMGTPDEVAHLALFLCSDEAGFITGAAYDIDGGVMGLR